MNKNFLKMLLVAAAGALAVSAQAASNASGSRLSSPVASPTPAGTVPILHVAGSTAFRAPLIKAIEDSMNITSFLFDGGPPQYKAGSVAYWGTLKNGGQEVIVKFLATGSAAGVIDLVAGQTLTKYIDNSAFGSFASGTNINGQTYNKETAAPDAATTDAFFSSVAASVATGTTSAPLPPAPTLASNINNAGLVDAGVTAGPNSTVGIVPFVWGASGTGLPFSNMTQEGALTLVQSGSISVSQLTGSSIDDYIFLIGRNEDSGTTIGAMAQSQNGFGQPRVQWAGTFTNNQKTQSDGRQTGGAGSTLSALAKFPITAVNTEPNLVWNTVGHSGYIGGGDVSNVLLTTVPGAPFTVTGKPTHYSNTTSHPYLVGYLGVADAVGSGTVAAPAGVGTVLNYEGVLYSPTAVENGTYSFWSYEHLYYFGAGAANPLGGTQQTAADQIADQIFSTDAPTNSSGVTTDNQLNAAGILFGDMKFIRNQEGSKLIPNQ